MYNVYMRTCMYYPDYAVDFIDYTNEEVQCKVSGRPLEYLDKEYLNRKTGCKYQLYFNPEYGITYRDRYNVNSKKADKGFIREHR